MRRVLFQLISRVVDLKILLLQLWVLYCTWENNGGGIFRQMMHNLPKIFPANPYKCSESTEDLPSDLPKYFSPFASSIAIHQNLSLQNFPLCKIY